MPTNGVQDISAVTSAGIGLLTGGTTNAGSAAAGGYLIYPNKPNTNSTEAVYSKYVWDKFQ
ncbi:hypothetical protein AAKU67_004069 [Oxalobacteraceae bacterium GrIS 2.11]